VVQIAEELVETVHGRKEFVLVPEVVLAKLPRPTMRPEAARQRKQTGLCK